jgi:hypothetical protein
VRFAPRAAALCLLIAPAWAHVVSMSSGDLTIDGARAKYELRMPLYEIAHVPHPETALLDHVRFAGAKLLSRNCVEDKPRELYICEAEYDFGAPPDRIDVACTLSSITVPNHVHMLRAEMGGKRDQGMFDAAFPRATLRFRPPTAAETAIAEAGGGFLQSLGGPVQILFLAALVLAARSRRELAALVLMFLAGQVLAVVVTPHTRWQPAPRFVEAAAALTVAYLAIEILLLPKAGSRWAVAGVLGVFHGLYFYLFLQAAEYRPGFVLAGAAVAEVVVVSVLALVLAQVRRFIPAQAWRPVPLALLVFGMVWFVLRLRG